MLIAASADRRNPPRAANGNVIGKSQLFPRSRSAADAAGMRNHREDARDVPPIRDGSRSSNVRVRDRGDSTPRNSSLENRESRPPSVKLSPARSSARRMWMQMDPQRSPMHPPRRCAEREGGTEGTRPARGALRALITIHLAERTGHFSGSTAGQFR